MKVNVTLGKKVHFVVIILSRFSKFSKYLTLLGNIMVIFKGFDKRGVTS